MATVRNWLQSLAEGTPPPLRRFVSRYVAPKFLLRYHAAQVQQQEHERRQRQQLARAMWAGFGTCAANELEAIESDGTRPSSAIAQASLALSGWYAFIGEHERALRSFRVRRSTSPTANDDIRQLTLEAATLLRLGHFDEANALVRRAIERLGELPEFCLLAANALADGDDRPQFERDRLRLEWFNKPLLSGGVVPLELRDGRYSISLDNIIAHSTDRSSHAAVKVSVLMPAYNAERTIATAIDSLLSQTWKNLELVVVDDGSCDETWSIIQSYAARDSRIVALRHESNRGAYPARNTALSAATGELVTVHDSDDWSHPQRVSLQASDLLQSDQLANTTDLIRVDRQLSVRISRNGTVLGENYSSLMTRREIVLTLGGWDECKMAADGELYDRLLLKYAACKNVVKQNVPLCLAAVRNESLTSRPDIGLSTFQYGARREYREAYRHWHQLEAAKTPANLFKLPTDRRFPIPNICMLQPHDTVVCDVLFVSDFSQGGDIASHGISMLRAAHALGLRCGLFHWPHLLSAGININSDVRQLLHEGVARSIVAGETVASHLVIVCDPTLLRHAPDRLPIVQTRYCLLLMSDAVLLLSNGRPRSSALERILDGAHAAFGVAPLLAPDSADLRTLLVVADCQNLTALDWIPLVNSDDDSTKTASFAERLKPYLDLSAENVVRDAPQRVAVPPHSTLNSDSPHCGAEVRTVFVLLEYCGGERTDELYSQLRTWNPGARILVLDNASPTNVAACVTHRNSTNSYIGGGIIDCINLAQAQGARYLFFCANDIKILDRLDIAEFQTFLDLDAEVVQVSCAVTPDSTQARNFPWMVRRQSGAVRRVRQADLVCCLVRLDFLSTFGGFPFSKGGWGYSAELAFHAKLQGKKIYVNDRCAYQHLARKRIVVTELGETVDKSTEVSRIYSKRYGDWLLPRSVLAEPPFDEGVDVASKWLAE